MKVFRIDSRDRVFIECSYQDLLEQEHLSFVSVGISEDDLKHIKDSRYAQDRTTWYDDNHLCSVYVSLKHLKNFYVLADVSVEDISLLLIDKEYYDDLD